MKYGLLSLVLGIVAVLAVLFAGAGPVPFFVALICSLAGIVTGIVALVKKEGQKALGIIGVALSGLALLFVLLIVIIATSNVLAQRSLLVG
jgi:hypothetical protein